VGLVPGERNFSQENFLFRIKGAGVFQLTPPRKLLFPPPKGNSWSPGPFLLVKKGFPKGFFFLSFYPLGNLFGGEEVKKGGRFGWFMAGAFGGVPSPPGGHSSLYFLWGIFSPGGVWVFSPPPFGGKERVFVPGFGVPILLGSGNGVFPISFWVPIGVPSQFPFVKAFPPGGLGIFPFWNPRFFPEDSFSRVFPLG